MKKRMLAALLALPLVAFDCGGKEDGLEAQWGADPFGLGCRLQVSGAVNENMWCIMTAYDYMPDFATTAWVFDLAAYRGFTEVGAGAGFFLEGRPQLGTAYGWSGDVASPVLLSGGAERAAPETMMPTHSAMSLGADAVPGTGRGALSVTFSQIPPVNATPEQYIQVHGTLTATLPSDTGGAPVTFTASF